jgi:hypothetical protein
MRRSNRLKPPTSDKLGLSQFCDLPTIHYDTAKPSAVAEMAKAAVEFQAWGQPCVFSPKDSQRADLQLGFQSSLNGLQNDGNQWKTDYTVSSGGKVRFDNILANDYALSINLSRNGDDDGNPPADALQKCGTFQGQLFAALEDKFKKLGFEVEHRAVATGAKKGRRKRPGRTGTRVATSASVLARGRRG